jgi:O-acetylhomoserine (thiol)-lyase
MDFAEESTVAAFLLRARREGLRDFGACMSADDRLPAAAGHRDAAAAHAAPRRQHAQGRRPPRRACRGRVGGYPELPRATRTTRSRSGCCRAAAARCSASCSRADAPQGRKFIESLRVFSHLANVGDAKSLVIHPASTTHFRMSDEALRASGIHEGTVRLSIGLEDPQDLIADLEAGLRASQKA